MRAKWPVYLLLMLGLLVAARFTGPHLRTQLSEQQRLGAQQEMLREQLKKLPSARQENVNLTAKLSALKASLPSEEELPSVLATLQSVASTLGVTTGKVTRAVAPGPIAGVTNVNLELSVEGSYARVQAFVQTIARLPRAYTANAINLSASGDGQVQGTLQLTTYRRDPELVSPPAQGATP